MGDNHDEDVDDSGDLWQELRRLDHPRYLEMKEIARDIVKIRRDQFGGLGAVWSFSKKPRGSS